MARHALRYAALLAMLVFGAAPAFAAAYKCESSGRTVYSDAPCPDGAELDLKNTPGGAVSDTDAKKSGAQAAHNKAELKRLENERHKREAGEEKENKKAAREQDKKRKYCSKLAMRKKWAEDDARSSVGKSSDKAKRKASHMAEQYAMECR
jgi:sRNA-binding protein